VTVGGPSPCAQPVSLNAATGWSEQVTDTDPIPGMAMSLPCCPLGRERCASITFVCAA
jgi:hypothetical protein